MKKLTAMCVLVLSLGVQAQNEYEITVESKQPSGIIDEMLYGQLFEHIYFSANNGVWQELIYGRSFEPEQYPGIPPRDGYFDGWYMDDDMILHSPTRYEQPLNITTIESDDYEITMDLNWRSYKLARRSWSGGLMDIRFAFGQKADGSAYFARIHDPYYEGRTFTPAQTQSQIDAANEANARAALQQQSTSADFSICAMEVRESQGFGGRPGRRMNTLTALASAPATKDQVNENQDWHKLRISRKGADVTMYFDDKEVVKYSGLELTGKNDLVFWVNYTEATYRNITVKSGEKTVFSGTPKDVQIPEVAPEWGSFGDAQFSLVKDDAVNMRYSQRIVVKKGSAGMTQGPQNIIAGEKYIGSIYAKGKGNLSVGLRKADGTYAAIKRLGKVGKEWKKYEFELEAGGYSGDADFAVVVEKGNIQVDMATLSTQTGKDLGGFRPDILQAVKELHPTCLRWPGGGYVAQYDWSAGEP